MAENPSKPDSPAPAAAEIKTDTKLASVGVPTPPTLRELAKDLPEKDKVQRAYKDAMLADTAQAEAKAKVIVVDESPDADQTPSGIALKKVAGVSNDTERGEKYAIEKTAVRWGHVPVS
jgi:hypothetical protein